MTRSLGGLRQVRTPRPPGPAQAASPVRRAPCQPRRDGRAEPTLSTSAGGARANRGALSCPGTGPLRRWAGFLGAGVGEGGSGLRLSWPDARLRARAASCPCATQRYVARTRPHCTHSALGPRSEFLAPNAVAAAAASCPRWPARQGAAAAENIRLGLSWNFLPQRPLVWSACCVTARSPAPRVQAGGQEEALARSEASMWGHCSCAALNALGDPLTGGKLSQLMAPGGAAQGPALMPGLGEGRGAPSSLSPTLGT